MLSDYNDLYLFSIFYLNCFSRFNLSSTSILHWNVCFSINFNRFNTSWRDKMSIINFNNRIENYLGLSWLESFDKIFWNDFNWNVNNSSKLDSLNFAFLCWWNWFEVFDIWRSLIDWNILNPFVNNWLYISVCNWNIMNIVHFDRVVWFVRNKVFDFYFLFQYLSKCFWDLLYWDICIFTQLNLLNTILTFWSNSLRFPDFNFISYFNRNICDSINVNSFCWFLGRIILIIDFNYWIWRGNNFINWSELFSVLLWYYVNWNISNIFKIQSVNKSFFNWCYRC